MKICPDIRYAAPEECLLDLYLPENPQNFTTILLMHGGGLEHGNRKGDSIRNMAEAFARFGLATVSVEYRMFPNHAYPDFIRDAAASVAWVKREIASYGGSGKVYVGGFSAGAYLSMMLCFDPQWLAAEGLKPLDVAGYLHGSAQATAHFNVLKYAGVDPRRVIIDESAPIWHITADSVVPPMLILVSDNDMENRLNQNQLLVGTMKHMGLDMNKVDYRVLHGTHCSFCKEVDAYGNPVFPRITLEFLRNICGEEV